MSDSEALAKLQTRLEGLERELAAHRQVSMALALALPEDRRVELLEFLRSLMLNAAALEGEDAAQGAARFLEKFVALTAPDLQASAGMVRLLLAQEALLMKSAPPHQQAAMRSWLAVATPEEIAAETLSLLPAAMQRKLSAPSAAKTRRKPGASKKR